MQDAGQILVRIITKYQKHKAIESPYHYLSAKYYAALHRLFSIITGSDIHRLTRISPDLKLPHPNGVIMHRDAHIGINCMVMQQVTIGQLADGAAPKIGNNVYIGAGAKVLGGITIGDHARIGANAVVLSDVPTYGTAVGIPARVIVKANPD